MSEQATAHEDAWIRKRREMQAGREGVINIKRSDDDTDLEYCEYFPLLYLLS